MSLDQFQQIYFEECDDLIDNLEQILVNIDLTSLSSETINIIFRCFHSIKGGSATFGFNSITSFTHIVENYLDLVRKEQLSLNVNSLDLLLKSIDCLRNLIEAYRSKNAPDETISSGLSEEFNRLLNTSTDAHIADESSAQETKSISSGKNNWIIYFKPGSEILKSGYDPLKILRVLGRLGEISTSIIVDELVNEKNFNPLNCYISWEIEIETVKTEQEIRSEAFEWVESNSIIVFNKLYSSSINQLDLVPTASEPEHCESKLAKSEIMQSSFQACKSEEPSFLVNDLQDAKVNNNPIQKTKENNPKISKDNLSIRVHTDKVDSLINMVGELVITQSMLYQIVNNFDEDKIEELKKGLAKLELNCREIQDNIMRIRMLPISNAFNRFKRMVIDLSRTVNKKIELNISGEDTELDKIVLEKIGDPLVHLVRNSIDHGLEKPEERRAAGKNEVGNIYLSAYHQGSNIVIKVGDDGRGICASKILAKAQEKGLVHQGKQLREDEILELIFAPGFSTAEHVTDISGRGVGMDVVKKNIEALNGRIDIKSTPGLGTTFSIILPLTLAILDGQLVRVGQETFVIPIIGIKEIIQIENDYINKISTNSEVYHLRNQYIPILRTDKLLKISTDNEPDLSKKFLVVIEEDKNHYGIVIDQLMQQQQAVIKSMDNYYKSIEGISGATILADGQVSLIIDPGGLVRLSAKLNANSELQKAS